MFENFNCDNLISKKLPKKIDHHHICENCPFENWFKRKIEKLKP